jgi:hypothetical protein
MTAVLEPVAADAVVEPQLNTMTAKALCTAVSDALLFTVPASAKSPMPEAVRLEFGGGQLVAVATDRMPARPPGDEWLFYRPGWLDTATSDMVGVR